MSRNKTLTQERHEAAEAALAALGSDVATHEVLVVQCPRSHHLGNVIDTDAGPVMRSIVGPHSHGRRDRLDVAHHAAERGREQFTLLDHAGSDQPTVTVWCDCGTRTLMVADIRTALAGSQRTLHVE